MGRGERLLQTLPDRWREARRAGAASARGAGGMRRRWGTWRGALGPPPAPAGHRSPRGGSSGGQHLCHERRGLSQGVVPPPGWRSAALQAPSTAID